MIWITPSEKDTATATLENRLWDAADRFRANSGPILGIVFLRFAENRLAAQRAKPRQQVIAAGSSRRSLGVAARVDEPTADHAGGVILTSSAPTEVINIHAR